MLYTIQNKQLRVTVSRYGAELQSIRTAAGDELLWQGDAQYWDRRSPILFPYIGRMIGKMHRCNGKDYPMDIHGFAPYQDWTVTAQDSNAITFSLSDNAQTLCAYPWHFSCQVCYRLTGNRLDVTFSLENRDDATIPFAIGGHPGFRIPDLENWHLRFHQACSPERIVFTADCFVDDHTVLFPLVNGTDLPLRHDLFDHDAIVLAGAAKAVSLEKNDFSRRITVRYPDMTYIGFWHTPKTQAPFLCIEPWSSLPSPKGERTVLSEQSDLLQLSPGGHYENTWSIEVE